MLLLILLALLLAALIGAGFVVKWLFIAAVIVALVWSALDDDRELMVRLDHEFHTFIWRQSRSPSVIELAGQLRARLAWFIREATITESQSLPTIVESHDQWLEALRARDLVRAGSEICAHYLRETESIVRLIASSDRLRSDPA
jgi:DNA-binding GntR family transcriptional regulator